MSERKRRCYHGCVETFEETPWQFEYLQDGIVAVKVSGKIAI